MLDLQTIFQIFRQTVIDYPYHECRRLNTFAVVDALSQFNQETLGKTWEDVKFGSYWVRNISPQSLQKKSAILAIETKDAYKNSFDSSLMDYDIWINVLDHNQCDDCDCNRSIDQVDIDNAYMLSAIISELAKYNLYNVDAGSGPVDLWLSEGRYQALKDSADIVDVKGRKTTLRSRMDAPLEIFTGGRGIDDYRIKTTMIKFRGCYGPSIDFNYSFEEGSTAGMIKCNTCP